MAEDVDIAAFKVGGSGTHSYDREHPSFMPEHLEAGTLNAHGVAGLLAGVTYIEGKGVDVIRAETQALATRFEEAVRSMLGVRVYGGGGIDRTGIVALNVADVDSATVADLLNAEYGICTRAGAHCAPLMHEAIGTDAQGAVRFSFSHFNTEEEIDAAIAAMQEIVSELA